MYSACTVYMYMYMYMCEVSEALTRHYVDESVLCLIDILGSTEEPVGLVPICLQTLYMYIKRGGTLNYSHIIPCTCTYCTTSVIHVHVYVNALYLGLCKSTL